MQRARARWRKPWRATASWRCCSERSPRVESTSRYSTTWRACDGTDLPLRSMRLGRGSIRRSRRPGGPEGGKIDHMHPSTEGLLESSLYVDDLAVSVQFYEKIFGFRVISDFGDRGCAMQAGTRQVLLLFKKGASRAIQSPHDGDGELHLAFAIAASELASWEAWLAENRIPVEEKRSWGFRREMPYFRDPDRHLVEVATPGVWSIY